MSTHQVLPLNEQDAAILDGLYAAVEDAGLAHRDAELALRRARVSQDQSAVEAAHAQARDAARVLRSVGEVYRSTLYSLEPRQRTAYLMDRHPYLSAS